MLRWLTRIALTVVLLAVVAVACAWLLMRGSLPVLDGDIDLPGLSAPVSVTRDALGIVTIEAASETDAVRALGYVHGQERFFEMDLMRRMAAGELAALFGPRALDTDRAQRNHRMRARVEARLDAIAGPRMAQLEAYAEGVNAGRSSLRVRPWPYLLLRQQPQAWTAADSALAGYAMYFDLQDATNGRELALWRVRPHLPPALFDLLVRDGTRWDAPLLGDARGDAVLPDAATLDLRTLPMPGADDTTASAAAGDLRPGSNNFAVAGDLTADGRAIVADDMHLGLRAPNIWFRARLRYPDTHAPGGRVDITGFTLPGLPAVIVGSNGHVAWGFTNSYGDYLDWRHLRPCTGDTPDAGCEPLARHAELIAVAGGDPVTHVVEETPWGPVLHREPDGSALALRWTAHLPGSLDFGLADFARAGSLDAALRVADRTAMPTQNLVIGDRHGRIAWRLLGPLAVRDAGCPALFPQADATCPPWPIATSASPSLASPTVSRLWTANARVVDGDALARVGDGGYAFGARARQIRDGLQARTRFDEQDLLAIQLDDRALFMAGWWSLLREVAAEAGAAPALRDLAAVAADWDGRASVDAAGYRIVRAWRLAVHARIADGLLAPARAALGEDAAMPDLPQLEGVAWPMVTSRPSHLLPRRFTCAAAGATVPDDCEDAGGWQRLFADAAVEVHDALAASGPLPARTWGERNTSAICHPLAAAVPLLGKRLLCMPATPLPGDGSMPRVQGPAFGASQRMVVAPGHEADGIAHMPGGQSGHPLSPFWGTGHAAWERGEATPFLPGAARHALMLQPD